MPLRVTLAEDSALLREGLVSILSRFGHDIIDAVADADSLTDAVQARRPDLIITDVRMPPGNANDGLRAAVRLRQHLPACRSWSSASTWTSRTRRSCWTPTTARASATS